MFYKGPNGSGFPYIKPLTISNDQITKLNTVQTEYIKLPVILI